MTKHLMSGNEAIARGAYEAGVKVCSAYPGTPSTEIFESLPQYKDALYTANGHRTRRLRPRSPTAPPSAEPEASAP